MDNVFVDDVEYTTAELKKMDDGAFEHLLGRAKMGDDYSVVEALNAARNAGKKSETVEE